MVWEQETHNSYNNNNNKQKKKKKKKMVEKMNETIIGGWTDIAYERKTLLFSLSQTNQHLVNSCFFSYCFIIELAEPHTCVNTQN